MYSRYTKVLFYNCRLLMNMWFNWFVLVGYLYRFQNIHPQPGPGFIAKGSHVDCQFGFCLLSIFTSVSNFCSKSKIFQVILQRWNWKSAENLEGLNQVKRDQLWQIFFSVMLQYWVAFLHWSFSLVNVNVSPSITYPWLLCLCDYFNPMYICVI